MTNFIEQFQAARRVGTPLVAIDTPDPTQTIEQLRNGAIHKDSPILQWDAVQGWTPGNKTGAETIALIMREIGAENPADATRDPVECVVLATKLPDKAVLFLINAHRYLADTTPSGAQFVQGVWNLRDAFKANLRTLVILGPGVVLPPELGTDVLALDEPLPTEKELGEIVSSFLESAEVAIDEPTLGKAVDALRGLPAFSAEQATALALKQVSPPGEPDRYELALDELWDRKKQMIAATPGLSVYMGGETFDDVGGNEQVKAFLRRILDGRDAPRVIVFIDEIEKAMAGTGVGGGAGDSSGVSQAFHGQFLTYTQNYNVDGVLEIGPPGSGKSAIAKAIGATGGIPTIEMDLGAMKGSLVGESERRLAAAFKIVTAVGGGRALFVATCNRMSTLSPELRRRFNRGIFFFDLPTQEEREVIWRIYEKKYDLGGEQRPSDLGWTGAEIRSACQLAYRLKMPLIETAQYIVPVSQSAKAEIEQLRRDAHNNFLSASKPGAYVLDEKAPYEIKVASKVKRTFGKEGLN